VAITLHTSLKPRPGYDQQQDPGERRHIEASAETYDDAYAALTAQVPDGWLMVGIARW